VTPLEAFQGLAAQSGKEDSVSFLFAHPLLLSPESWLEFERWASGLEPPARARALAQLSSLQRIHERVADRPYEYPIGVGPMEALWRRHQHGEVSFERARALAREPGLSSLLSLVYVRALSGLLESQAQREDWRIPVPCHRLLLEAVDARGSGPDQAEMWRTAVLAWLDIVARATNDVPDGRLFHHAVELGRGLERRSQERGDVQTQAEALHRLGVLHLDPYISGRTSLDFSRQLDVWQERLVNEHGRDILTLPEEEIRLPTAEGALNSAQGLLAEAVELRRRLARPLELAESLKARAEALQWLEIAGGTVNRQELLHTALEAMSLLDPELHPESWGVLEQIVGRVREPSDAGGVGDRGGETDDPPVEIDASELFDQPLEALLARYGARRLISLVVIAAGNLGRDDAEAALRLSERIRGLVAAEGSEKDRQSWLTHRLNWIVRALAEPGAAVDRNRGLAAAADETRRRSRAEGWDSRRLAATLLRLAGLGTAIDQEDEALVLLSAARDAAPDLAAEFGQEIVLLEATLLAGQAVNALNAGDLATAVEKYFLAVSPMVSLGLADHALNLVRRVIDLAQRLDSGETPRVLVPLAANALTIESAGGAVGGELIQELCRILMLKIADHGQATPAALLLLLQVAKGHRFSTALASGERYRVEDDPEAVEMLERVDRARAESAAHERATGKLAEEVDERGLDEETLLHAYTGRGEAFGGRSPHEVLYNLEHRFDAYVNRRLLEETGPSGGRSFASLEEVQRSLGTRSVAVDYYLGTGPRGTPAVYILLLTAEGAWFTIGELEGMPSAKVEIGDGGRRIVTSLWSFGVSALRRQIQEDPVDGSTVSAEAGEGLRDLRDEYFGGNVAPVLDRLRAAGKDHLLVVPHGPLHFFPFHLVGPPDQPLADEWIVSYLPSHALIHPEVRERRKSRRAGREVAALGLRFLPGNPHDLEPPLENAVAEAHAVAALFGEEELADEEATESALIAALTGSRRVHLATHGLHRVTAPSFQRLYLSPDPTSDGVLHAYELLGLDLSGLDLVTLSACETALGRFDPEDNLRGLPAALLLAGASTLVGTLWPVETTCAEIFFVTFYGHLRGDVAKLDAFAAAQRAARAEFPEHRDWGAFYLAGEWT